MKYRICIISSARTENVPTMMSHFPNSTWYVPVAQVAAYEDAGAGKVIGVKGPLPLKAKQTNTAIDRSFSSGKYDYVVTADDDIKGCVLKSTKKRIPVLEAVLKMMKLLDKSPYYLAGPYGGTNTLWSPPGERHYGSITGALQIHKCPATARFDSDIHGLGDVDFSIQHHVRYGGVLLCGEYCLDFNIKGNKGGWNSLRTASRVEHAVNALQSKWSEIGCKFDLDESKPSGIKFRVPWKRIAENS